MREWDDARAEVGRVTGPPLSGSTIGGTCGGGERNGDPTAVYPCRVGKGSAICCAAGGEGDTVASDEDAALTGTGMRLGRSGMAVGRAACADMVDPTPPRHFSKAKRMSSFSNSNFATRSCKSVICKEQALSKVAGNNESHRHDKMN